MRYVFVHLLCLVVFLLTMNDAPTKSAPLPVYCLDFASPDVWPRIELHELQAAYEDGEYVVDLAGPTEFVPYPIQPRDVWFTMLTEFTLELSFAGQDEQFIGFYLEKGYIEYYIAVSRAGEVRAFVWNVKTDEQFLRPMRFTRIREPRDESFTEVELQVTGALARLHWNGGQINFLLSHFAAYDAAYPGDTISAGVALDTTQATRFVFEEFCVTRH